MNDQQRTRTLLIEAHAAIATESRQAVARIGVSLRRKPAAVGSSELARTHPELVAAIAKSIAEMTLTYPPEDRPLTPAEEAALEKLELTRVEKSALRKLIADAGAAMMFRFFCLMDAVGAPDVAPSKKWLGASFVARKEGPMLHDQFGELYWAFKRATARRGIPRMRASRLARRSTRG